MKQSPPLLHTCPVKLAVSSVKQVISSSCPQWPFPLSFFLSPRGGGGEGEGGRQFFYRTGVPLLRDCRVAQTTRPPVKPTGLPPVRPAGPASGHGSGILLRIKFPPPLRIAGKALLCHACNAHLLAMTRGECGIRDVISALGAALAGRTLRQVRTAANSQ